MSKLLLSEQKEKNKKKKKVLTNIETNDIIVKLSQNDNKVVEKD